MFNIDNRLKAIMEGAVETQLQESDEVALVIAECVMNLFMTEAAITQTQLNESVLSETTFAQLIQEAAEGDANTQKQTLEQIKAKIKSMVVDGTFKPKSGLNELKMINLMNKRIKLQWAMGLLLNPIIAVPLIIISIASKYRSIDKQTAEDYVKEATELKDYFTELKDKAEGTKVKQRLTKAIAQLERKIEIFNERIRTWSK